MGDDLEVQGRPFVLKDNYDEQMKRLRLLCEAEGLAPGGQDVTLTLKFAYQGSKMLRRTGTVFMKDRIEAALREFDLVYTMVQDPESSSLEPVYVVFLTGPTRTILDFYEAIGRHE